jgi:DNA-binding MarR family transcriptional regulator
MSNERFERSRQLSEQLRNAFKLMIREMRRDSDPGADGLPLMQTMLLVSVAEHPGVGVAELARMQQVRTPTMSAQVKALVDAGLVARDAPDPDDRRRSGLQLTAAGQDRLREVHARRIDWLAQRIARLTPAQVDALAAAIEPLTLIAKS